MGLGGILKGIGNIGLSIGSSLIPGGSLAKDALKAGIGAAGSAIGAMSQGGAQNRDAQFSGQMDLAQMLSLRDEELQRLRAQADNDYTSNQVAREQEGRVGRSDAWHKLLSAQHTLNPGAAPQLAGKYNIAPRQASDAERSGADALTSEVMARLQGGNPIAEVQKRDPKFDYDPMSTIDPRLMKPGTGEKLGGILSPILSGIGGIMNAGGNTGVMGPPKMGTPGAPTLTPADLAWLRTQNPQLAA